MKKNSKIHKVKNHIAYALFYETGIEGVQKPTHIYHYNDGKLKYSGEVKLINYKGKSWWVEKEEFIRLNEKLKRFDQVSRMYWIDKNGEHHFYYDCLDRRYNLHGCSPMMTFIHPASEKDSVFFKALREMMI